MREINIEKKEKPGGWEFNVTVEEEEDSSEHKVKLERSYYDHITNGVCKPEELIRESFIFLLKREPKEQIMNSFNLKVIQRYFPEYEDVIRKKI